MRFSAFILDDKEQNIFNVFTNAFSIWFSAILDSKIFYQKLCTIPKSRKYMLSVLCQFRKIVWLWYFFQ